MKITLSRRSFLDALKLALPATNARSTLPVLSCIRIATDDRLVSLCATNLEIAVQANLVGTITEPGAICINAKTLSDLLTVATGDEVKIETDGPNAHLKWGKSKNKLPTISAEEFPPMPPFVYEGAEIEGAILADAVRKVAFSALDDEYRPIFRSINVANEKGHLVFATTDGRRLSVKKLDAKTEINTLIPAAALSMVARMARDEAIRVRATDNGKVIFTGTGWQLAAQTTAGMFPDYQVIIPRSFKTKVTVDTGALKAAIAQIKAVGASVIELTINGSIALHGAQEGNGEADAEVDAQIDGPAQIIAFNLEYLSQAVNVMGPQVILSMNDGQSAVSMTGEDNEYKHILMPLHK